VPPDPAAAGSADIDVVNLSEAVGMCEVDKALARRQWGDLRRLYLGVAPMAAAGGPRLQGLAEPGFPLCEGEAPALAAGGPSKARQSAKP
jgi:hypothetical protein